MYTVAKFMTKGTLIKVFQGFRSLYYFELRQHNFKFVLEQSKMKLEFPQKIT